jgi:periplasmic protein CpxP/Spy
MRPLLSIIVLLIGLSVGLAKAQEPTAHDRTPEDIAKQQTNRLAKELSLSDAQQTAVYGINLKYAQQNKELRKSMLAAKKRSESRDKELKALLNDDQQQKLSALRASQKEKAKQARMARNNATPPTD